jgi:hypothetical protein
MRSTADGCLEKPYLLSQRFGAGIAHTTTILPSFAKLRDFHSVGKRIHPAIEANTDISDKHRW